MRCTDDCEGTIAKTMSTFEKFSCTQIDKFQVALGGFKIISIKANKLWFFEI